MANWRNNDILMAGLGDNMRTRDVNGENYNPLGKVDFKKTLSLRELSSQDSSWKQKFETEKGNIARFFNDNVSTYGEGINFETIPNHQLSKALSWITPIVKQLKARVDQHSKIKTRFSDKVGTFEDLNKIQTWEKLNRSIVVEDFIYHVLSDMQRTSGLVYGGREYLLLIMKNIRFKYFVKLDTSKQAQRKKRVSLDKLVKLDLAELLSRFEETRQNIERKMWIGKKTHEKTPEEKEKREKMMKRTGRDTSFWINVTAKKISEINGVKKALKSADQAKFFETEIYKIKVWTNGVQTTLNLTFAELFKRYQDTFTKLSSQIE